MNQLQNYVQLIGNLGNAPERISTKSGSENAMVRFRLATNESYINKNNERVENTQWHTCLVYGKKAEVLEQYCHKGSKIAIQGRLRYNEYKDKDGVNRLGTSIQVSDFLFLDGKKQTAG